MPGLFGGSSSTPQTSGSKRDAAPQGGLAQFNPNMSPQANYWQGNQFMIPGAQGLGNGIVNPAQPAAPAQTGPRTEMSQQQKPGLMQQILGAGGIAPFMAGKLGLGGSPMSSGILGAAGGGLAGALGGGSPSQQGGSAMSQLPAQGTAPGGMAGALGGGAGNPGIAQLLAMLQQRQQAQ